MSKRRTGASGFGFVLAAILGVVIALCPAAISTSRERSRRIACCGNLKQVGLGLKMYAGDHGDMYPDKIEECSRYLGHQAPLLICPSSGSELVSPRILDNVGAWMDYTYVSGLPESVSPETVIAYCPAKNHKGDGGNVLFADGHVSWFNSEIAERDGIESSLEDVIGTIGETRKP